MNQRVFIYTRSAGTEPELVRELRRAAESRGDIGGGRRSSMMTGSPGAANIRVGEQSLARLDQVDQIVVGGAGDLPGRVVNDLLKFSAHSAIMMSASISIVSRSTPAAPALPCSISSQGYRAAKLSQAIKTGQTGRKRGAADR